MSSAAPAAAAADPEIDLLRAPVLRRPGAAALALSRKDAALLAVLALDGQAARDTLAEMLWPEVDLARARASLRQRRFRLARAAGRPLIEGEHTLRLASGVATSVQEPDRRLADDPAALDGDLLDGLGYSECPEFERWLALARERWHVMRSQALARLASRLEAQARIAPALAIAQRLCADEPLSDHAHRRLMRLHHRRGDLGAALDVYRRFADRLGAELGELPDDETASLAAQLRQGGDQRLARAPAPLPPGLQGLAPLVGRDAAWQALQNAWDAGDALVVEGAPGMGKTRLLAEFLDGRAGCLRVGARPGDADRPFALLARLLAALWFEPGSPWHGGASALPAWARRELAALLPELGEAPPRIDPLRLQRALQIALEPRSRETARLAPVVAAPQTPPSATALEALPHEIALQALPHEIALQALVLDDVQQADLATLELLPALARPAAGSQARALPTGPRWWLAVRRGEQPAPLSAWMASSDPPRSVVLEALGSEAVGELLQAVAPEQAAPDARELQRYTGGIPLFVLETLRSLYEHAALPEAAAAAPSHPGSWGALLAGVAPPVGAAAVVQGRLRRLPEAASQLATAAAVLHGPVSLADAAELLGTEATPLLDAFRALQAAHWLDASGRMHDLVRQAVLADQAAPVRRWLHARAATQLARHGAPPQEQARHWLQAGSPEQAAPLFQQAALAVRRSARPREETELWDASMAAYEAAGQARQAFAAWRESIEPRLFSVGPKALAGQTAALLARAADDHQRLDALVAHAEVQLLLADAEPVRQLATEAMMLARRCGDPGNEVKAGLVLASWLAQRGHSDEALATLDGLAQVLAAAPALRHAWISTRSFALHRAGRFAACAEMLEQAAALAEAANDGMELCTTRSNMASMLVSLGRYDEALAAVQVALRVREDLGPAAGVHHANVDLNHGYVLMGLGRPHSARAAMARARDGFAASDGLGTWQVIAGNALAAAELACGDAAAAQARLLAPTADTPPFVAARHHILQARVRRARQQDPGPALAQAESVLGPQGDPVQRLLLRAEGWCGRPDTQAAEAAAGLVGLQAELQAIEQGAQAARLGWLAVERWLVADNPIAAVSHLRALLQPTAPRPIDLLPRTWWALAACGLQAAGDEQAAADARRRLDEALLQEDEDARGAECAGGEASAAAAQTQRPPGQ